MSHNLWGHKTYFRLQDWHQHIFNDPFWSQPNCYNAAIRLGSKWINEFMVRNDLINFWSYIHYQIIVEYVSYVCAAKLVNWILIHLICWINGPYGNGINYRILFIDPTDTIGGKYKLLTLLLSKAAMSSDLLQQQFASRRLLKFSYLQWEAEPISDQ